MSLSPLLLLLDLLMRKLPLLDADPCLRRLCPAPPALATTHTSLTLACTHPLPGPLSSFPIFVRDDVARLARETQGAQYEIREARKVCGGAAGGPAHWLARCAAHSRRGASPHALLLCSPAPAIAMQALRAVNTELSAVDKQRATLAERKEALEAKLSELGATAEEPRKAQPAPKAKAAAKRGGAKGRAQPAKRGKRAGSDDDSDGEWRP